MLELIAAAAVSATTVPAEPAKAAHAAPPARCALVPGSVEESGKVTRRTFMARCPGTAPSPLSLAYGPAERSGDVK